jgi:cell division protein FtsW
VTPVAHALARADRLVLTRRSAAQEVLHAGRVVLGVAVALTALGLVVIYSSSSGRLAAREEDTSAALARQIRFVLLGAAVGWLVSRAALGTLAKAARPLFTVTLVLLAATLVVGPEINQSRRWIHALGFSLQPSEVLKIAVLLYLADRLGARDADSAFGDRTPVLGLLAPIALGTGLVLVEPDLGTALFVVAEAVVLLALAGIRPTRFVPFVAAALPLVLVYAWSRFAHVQRRVGTFLEGAKPGDQVFESLIAIGSGGLLGRGLGEGTQKLFYVAEANTDFIFAVLGEELGFVATASVVLAFMAFTWYGRKVAWRARAVGPQAYYLAAGATFVVAFQALVNVAVVTAAAPTKGVSLPFLSLGGSNLLMASAAVGILVNVARRTASAVS